jgi:hypothetical protein
MKGFWILYRFNNWLSSENKFMLDCFLGGGWHQGYYKGYYISTGERYETVKTIIKVANGCHMEA